MIYSYPKLKMQNFVQFLVSLRKNYSFHLCHLILLNFFNSNKMSDQKSYSANKYVTRLNHKDIFHSQIN
jgi:hypothetical protein